MTGAIKVEASDSAMFGMISDEDWRSTPASVKALVLHLVQENRLLRERIERLEAEVEELRERLGTSSANSSLPPSVDFRSGKKKKKRRRDCKAVPKRARGGQPGHKGVMRALLPAEKVDHTIACHPASVCTCGGRVVSDGRVPEVRQKLDIPPVSVETTNFMLYSGLCSVCGKRHRGSLPAGVPEGLLMPRAMALVVLYSGKYHLSKRAIEDILHDTVGLDVSLGTISNTEQRVSKALAAPVAEAREYIKHQPVVSMDETGHKVAGKRAWMWLAATSLVAVFVISASRGAKVAKEILGESFAGILCSDRWNAYNWISALRRQLCWAHLIRDFTKIAQRSGRAGEIGDELLFIAQKKLFRFWHLARDGLITRTKLIVLVASVREKLEALLQEGVSCGHAATQRTCKRLLKLKDAMWTFTLIPGIEPTNNFAERLIRAFVLWRKTSFGTQSNKGNHFVERIMTVSATCQLQRRNILDYITTAIKSHASNHPFPSLLPEEENIDLACAA